MYNREKQTEGLSPNKQELFTIQAPLKRTKSELTARKILAVGVIEMRWKRNIHVTSSCAPQLRNV